MKKREFLAMGGAVPLMLAGCGGNGSGSAPVRLVNASVGYGTAPGLGFIVDTTQAVTGVLYGQSSPFETVEAGSVTTALTVTGADGTNATVGTPTVRNLSKDQRYSLIAYGFSDELKSVLMTESTVTPDTGKANINVLNTSVDVGPVDVYLSTTPVTAVSGLALATLMASNVGAVTQSQFFSALPGAYYIVVVGAGSVAEGRSDIRFSSPSAITLTDQEVVTIILTPGASGTLANAIVLVQGTTAASNQPTVFQNTTARLRVVTAAPASTAVTVAYNGGPTIVASTRSPTYTNYVVVNSLKVPTVTVSGNSSITWLGSINPVANANAALLQGGDYTLMIWTDAGGNNATAELILDDNTAPTSTSGVKFRLINLAYNDQGLALDMNVNGLSIASGVTFGNASQYTEVTAPQTTNSTVDVLVGATTVASHSLVLTAGNIFTEIVVGYDVSTTPPTAQDFFRSSSGT